MQLFDEQLIEWIENDIDWKTAVHKGVELLVKNNYATFELEEKIFESTEKYGAYYVLEKGIALVHAPCGDYCFKPATSTLVLKNEVEFNNQKDKTAKIIITLCAPDSSSHMGLIEEFGHYFTNVEFKQKVLKVKSLDEFLKIVMEFKKHEY